MTKQRLPHHTSFLATGFQFLFHVIDKSLRVVCGTNALLRPPPPPPPVAEQAVIRLTADRESRTYYQSYRNHNRSTPAAAQRFLGASPLAFMRDSARQRPLFT